MDQSKKTGLRAIVCHAAMLTISLSASAQEGSMIDDYSMMAGCDQTSCEPIQRAQDCCRQAECAGFYGELQFVHLRALASEGDTFSDFGVPGARGGLRINLGYETSEGLGTRLRYFDYDGIQPFTDGAGGLKAQYFDLEITDRFRLGHFRGVLSAGYRHANLDELYQNDFYTNFEGDGLTLGGMLQRNIGGNLSLYGWTQYSILTGIDTAAPSKGLVMSWSELQLGGQYDKDFAGYNTFVRGGAEAQQQHGVVDDDSEDMGLFGWFLSAGVTY